MLDLDTSGGDYHPGKIMTRGIIDLAKLADECKRNLYDFYREIVLKAKNSVEQLRLLHRVLVKNWQVKVDDFGLKSSTLSCETRYMSSGLWGLPLKDMDIPADLHVKEFFR